MQLRYLSSTAILLALAGCGGEPGGPGGQDDGPDAPPGQVTPPTQNATLDDELRALVQANGLTGDPSTGRVLPSINDPLPQLGKRLFFTKALSGGFDTACVSCHHPLLGGGDGLSLSVGVGANDPDLLGPGRADANGVPDVPRNAPTLFNIGLWDSALFWDSRVESLGKEALANGAASGISTPDSGVNMLDAAAGPNLVAAQARFPVAAVEEMRGGFLRGQSPEAVRQHLAARLGDVGVAAGEIGDADWLSEFQTAFQSAESADALITYDNIALALSEYERSQVFVANPWREYVQGNNNAISNDAKQGAILFLTLDEDGGAGCVQCHAGDLFTDQRHHTIGAPQFGPGAGMGMGSDIGRELRTGMISERFRFRTPSLLNIEVTGPYMHTGAYETLDEVLDHYDNPDNEVDDFFDDGGWCQLEQFDAIPNCDALYPRARINSFAALDRVDAEQDANDPDAMPNININNNEKNQIEAFLRTLTDPCVESRTCLSPWIATADEAADDHQLNAVDANGNAL